MINSQILRIIKIRWNLVWVSIYTLRVDTPQLNVPKDYIVFLLLPVVPSNLGLNSELEQKRARKWRWQIYVAQIMQKYQHPPSAGRVADSFSAKSWRKSGSLNENRQIYEAPIICLTKKISVPPHRLLLGSSLKISNPRIIWATSHIFLATRGLYSYRSSRSAQRKINYKRK